MNSKHEVAVFKTVTGRGWCSPNPLEFPVLLETTTNGSLAVVLSQHDFENQWSEGTIFDKFLIILTLSAASAPYFNMEPTNTKESHLSLMIKSLTDLMDAYSERIIVDGGDLAPKALDTRTPLSPIPEFSEPIEVDPQETAGLSSPNKFSTPKRSAKKRPHSEVEEPTPTRTS
jgi:hypothetical protein